MAQPYQLVIDLGTCHTVAVVRRDGQAPRPLLFDGSPLLPSGVYRDERGTRSVGRDAERLSQLDPTRFEPYPKRTVDDGVVLLGDGPTPVVEMFAALLRRVLTETTEGTPKQVTLTCPADWGPQRRDILRAAARAAGLPDVRLVDEPIAAATYCVEVLGTPIPVGGCLLVVDLGGGSLDVTVVRHDPDGLRVLAVGGLDDLGGVDIDAALVGHLGQLVAIRQPEVWQRLVNPRTPGEQRDRRRFWTEVRAAKEMLSRAPSAPIQIPGSDDAIHLTREELERVAGPLVDRAVDETRRVLGRAGLATGALSGILLVGGSSRPAPAQPGAAQPGAAAQPGLLTWPAAQPPGAVPAPVPAPAPVRRRALVRGLITTAVVVALAIGLSYGGVQLFGAAKKAVGNLPGIGTAGGAGGGGQGGSGGGLAPVGAPIDLSGDGARSVAAGANLVFYAVSGNGKTVVHAVDPATGREKWAQSVVLDPSEASMHTVGDLLVVDGKASATDAGKDMRVVLQTGDGKLLQKLDWSRREDVAYLGTDAIVATTWEPYQTVRVNLRTGQTVWKSPPIASINAEHPVNPELTWTAGPADVAAPIKGFTESFGVNPNRFVQIDGNEGTAQVINGAGKVTPSGKVGLDDPINQPTWTAFDGLVTGALH